MTQKKEESAGNILEGLTSNHRYLSVGEVKLRNLSNHMVGR